MGQDEGGTKVKTRIWIVLALLVPLVCSLGGVTGNALEQSIDLDEFMVTLGEQEILLGNGGGWLTLFSR